MPIPQRPLRYIGGGELTAFLTNQIVQRKPLRGKCYLNMSHYIINGGACQYFCKKNSLLLYEKNSGALRQKTKAASFRGIVALSEVQSAKRSACIRIFFQFLFLRICLKRFPFRVAPVPPAAVSKVRNVRACTQAPCTIVSVSTFPRNRRAAKHGCENNYCIKMHINLKLLHISEPNNSTFLSSGSGFVSIRN